MKLPEQHAADEHKVSASQKKLLERARGGKGFDDVFKDPPINIPTNPITKETKV